MKNRYVFVILLVLVLGFGLTAQWSSMTPRGAITVSQLLGSFENVDMNTLRFVEFHEEYLMVEFNGKRLAVVPDSQYIENEVVLVTFDNFDGLLYPKFQTINMFDKSNWNLETKNHPSLEYIVLRDYKMGIPMNSAVDSSNESALRIVIVPVDLMPKVVEVSAWEGTEANFWIWNAPLSYPWIVHNANTGEIAFFHGSIVDRYNGINSDLVPGMQVVGVLSMIVDSNGRPTILINR